MKVKDLIKALSKYNCEDEVLAFLYDKEVDIEYECDFFVDDDEVPIFVLREIRRYQNEQ